MRRGVGNPEQILKFEGQGGDNNLKNRWRGLTIDWGRAEKRGLEGIFSVF